ncbi:MAG: phosphoribosylformylglycinamidine synthase I [bacterium]|jgi:phosphoribosylformylglycinamidine synthase|nr:phosphoribosylformylglycinamidine synthase I [bacterium]
MVKILAKPKILILRTAGTNCDMETAQAFSLAGGEPQRVHINRFIAGEVKLNDYSILAIPGGFSYGDDIASGKVLANELRYKLYEQISAFAASGKPVIGICNGFQVLVKAGLLPGFETIDQELQATLSFNDSAKFEDRWVYLKISNIPHPGTGKSQISNKCLWTKGIKKIIYLPVAHGEGKFIPKDKEVLDRLKKNGQVVLEYVDKRGVKAGYPYNPNGSVENIAGICNPAGNVFGLMPHPERHVTKYNHPQWTRNNLPEIGDGLAIFINAVNYVLENKKLKELSA